MVLTDGGNTVFFHSVNFDEPQADPIQGDPKALLEEWKRRLALTFDPEGRIVPLYPIPSPQRDREPDRVPGKKQIQ
jgi:hypothetical protein